MENQIKFEEQNLPFTADCNIAMPEAKIKKNNLLLSFDAWDVRDGPDFIARILFEDVLMYRIGSPNDHGFWGFGSEPGIRNDSMYYKKAFPNLDFFNFYKVIGWDWKNKELIPSAKIINPNYKEKEGYNHYVYFMRDGTFECVAKDYKILDKIQDKKPLRNLISISQHKKRGTLIILIGAILGLIILFLFK